MVPFIKVSSRQSRKAVGQPLDGAKRREILAAATERFGRDGYEDTRWADIARDVGVGPTALYHYFESKQHCLFVILEDALTGFQARFEALTAGAGDHRAALGAVLSDCFALDEREVLRNRVLVAEQGKLGLRSVGSSREATARHDARRRARQLERAWAGFLGDAMRAGAIPRADPHMLTLAIIGLYNSIWHWYRSSGRVSLAEAAGFFTERALAMVG
jgi:TetR/AcrR family transcriptional regulator, cholesterol catabolism regulator